MKVRPAKEYLEKLYETYSLSEMAAILSVAKSTLYGWMDHYEIPRRSRGDAIRKHLEDNGHHRTGTQHTEASKRKISQSSSKFWSSREGRKLRKKLGDERIKQWKQLGPSIRARIITRLNDADKPSPGQLSRFGSALADFLSEYEKIDVGKNLTGNHVSDIILPERRVVLELLIPVSVYGEVNAHKVQKRYNKIVGQLQDNGYRVVVIEDKSNSVSRARCERVYNQLKTFFNSKKKRLDITS